MFCCKLNYIAVSIIPLSVGCFIWQNSNCNYSLSFRTIMILIWRECIGVGLLSKIASCEMFELVQKWFLFSEACPALLLGTVRWTLATLMAQEVSEVPRTLSSGTSKPSLPPDNDCLSSFEIPYYPQCYTQQETENTFVPSTFFFK